MVGHDVINVFQDGGYFWSKNPLQGDHIDIVFSQPERVKSVRIASGSQRPGNEISGKKRSGNKRSGNQRFGNKRSGNEISGKKKSGNQRSGNDSFLDTSLWVSKKETEGRVCIDFVQVGEFKDTEVVEYFFKEDQQNGVLCVRLTLDKVRYFENNGKVEPSGLVVKDIHVE